MTCWRVLQLPGEIQGTPQLLIKTRFSQSTYIVYLTDLSNIWCEELNLPDIVRRAADVESPIEVTERDTAQLAILFDNIQKSLNHGDDASCALSRDNLDNLILRSTITLPEPLDSLTWKFQLTKGTATTLKNELILPLLVSSHVQHTRLSRLLSVVGDKDRAITRLVDQYEASNLDLAAAFPSIGNAKSGRRVAKREQAARHIPALQVFNSESWKAETAHMVDNNVSTLDLFQEALSECTPKVPPKLQSDDEETKWWADLDHFVQAPKRSAKPKVKPPVQKTPAPVQAAQSESETEEEETEDEFETHENFKSRGLPEKSRPPAVSEPEDVRADGHGGDDHMEASENESDDEDLDAPPKAQSERPRGQSKIESPEPRLSAPKNAPTIPGTSSSVKPKAKGFKIGGKARKTESPPAASEEEAPKPTSQGEGIPTRVKIEEAGAGSKPLKKGFKIGGRSKTQPASASEEPVAPGESRTTPDASTRTQSRSTGPSVSTETRPDKQGSPVEEQREETEAEKVERKRRELKRKNEELAKKQSQSKKKKRF